MRSMCLPIALVLVGLPAVLCCGGPPASGGGGPAGPPPKNPGSGVQGHDWTRFDWDVGRSGASTAPTGITATNVAAMVRQQVPLDGTVDASAIYLSAVQVNGTTHDVFFVTTSYGKTIAVSADSGAILWTYTPP